MGVVVDGCQRLSGVRSDDEREGWSVRECLRMRTGKKKEEVVEGKNRTGTIITETIMRAELVAIRVALDKYKKANGKAFSRTLKQASTLYKTSYNDHPTQHIITTKPSLLP
jgi:hypothetical protein